MQPPLAALLELEVLHDVRQVDLVAVDADLLERAVELASRRAHERPAGAILAVTRLLADEHHPRAFESLPEDRLGRVAPEVTALALGRRLAQRVEAPALG